MLPPRGAAHSRALRQAAPMSRWQLRGTYYGEGVPTASDLETPEGRQRMREVITELLTTAEASGASDKMPTRMRQDLAVLDE